jgi:hypothetical protein
MTSATDLVEDVTSPAAPPTRRRVPGVEALVVATLGVFGFRVGIRAISDNSAFVHLRTGIEMVRTWHIPRSDPYSFTAHGLPWTVQSWFASLLYGLAYHVGGFLFGTGGQLHTELFLQGALMAALAVLIARLARTGVAVRTMASAGVAVLFGAVFWSPRPLVIGLLGLVLLITVVESEANPWWIVPITWVWVNSHGSFPLGALWLGLVYVGAVLDSRTLVRRLWPYLLAEVAGLVVSVVNPIGFHLLTFPLTVEQKASVFRNVVEWRSPNFQTGDGIYALVLIVLALVIVLRARLAWSDILPVVAFLAAGLYSLRFIAPAAVVLAPVLGRALRPRAPVAERPPDPGLDALSRLVAACLALLVLVFGVLSLRGSGLDLSTYPAAAESWMASHGYLDPSLHRVAEQDVVGGYLILLRGSRGRVFIDDRVDMYPVSVSDDYDTLLHAQPGAAAVLDKYRVDTVLWDRHLALPGLLLTDGGWRTAYEDKGWIVLVRSPAAA